MTAREETWKENKLLREQLQAEIQKTKTLREILEEYMGGVKTACNEHISKYSIFEALNRAGYIAMDKLHAIEPCPARDALPDMLKSLENLRRRHQAESITILPHGEYRGNGQRIDMRNPFPQAVIHSEHVYGKPVCISLETYKEIQKHRERRRGIIGKVKRAAKNIIRYFMG